MKWRSSCSVLALALALALSAPSRASAGGSGSSSIDADARIERAHASTFFLEGALQFLDGDRTLAFDSSDDKLGNLASLKPGEHGLGLKAGVNVRRDPVWDFGVGAGLLGLTSDRTSAEYVGGGNRSSARQNMVVGNVDLEVGRHLVGLGETDLRLLGGVRVLGAQGHASWEAPADDKSGRFDDRLWAVGPRVGAELSHPVGPNLTLVAGASTSVLFGRRKSSYDYDDGASLSVDRSSVTVWNSDAMAGLAMPIGHDARLTLGYRAQHWRDLAANRSDVDKNGGFDLGGRTDTLVHGPFARLTVPLAVD